MDTNSFDKELEKQLKMFILAAGVVTLNPVQLERGTKAIKQAVDKYVIKANGYAKAEPIGNHPKEIAHTKSENEWNETRNELKAEQRQSLWGDKK